jgi:hypothetical protein
MQKALRLMNIRLDVVINDIMGKSGRAIIEAILSGERNPHRLSLLANYRVKKSREEIAKSLEGNWREDLLFEIRECLFLHDVYCNKIEVCDRQIEEKIKSVVKEYSTISSDASLKKSKTSSKFSPIFDIEGLAHQYFGVNLFDISGVSHNTVLCLLSHMGHDIDKFPSSKHFCSWLRLSPNNKISGGKILSSRTPKGKSVLSLALRQAANSIGNQQKHPMAPFFRRVAFKKGRGAAVTATARKLAVIIYNMVTKKESYLPFNYAMKTEQMQAKRIAKIKNQLSVLKPDELKSLFQNYSSSIT